jgi:hypothetical protein
LAGAWRLGEAPRTIASDWRWQGGLLEAAGMAPDIFDWDVLVSQGVFARFQNMGDHPIFFGRGLLLGKLLEQCFLPILP